MSALFLTLAGCGPAMNFEKKDYRGVFRHDAAGFGFALEKNWEVREGIPNALVACRFPLERDKGKIDKFRENFVIQTSEAVSDAASLKKAAQPLEQLPGYKPVDEKVDGVPYVTYTYDAQGDKLKARCYYLKAEKLPISLTFTSTEADFERWLPTFEDVLGRIKLKLADVPAPQPKATPSGSPSGTPAASASLAPTPTASPATPVTATPAPSETAPATATPASSPSPIPTAATPTATPSVAPSATP